MASETVALEEVMKTSEKEVRIGDRQWEKSEKAYKIVRRIRRG